MATEQFSILEASVIFSRSNGSEIEIDIKSNILEFQTFEHLQKSYVDARIVFIDDFGLKNNLSVQGVERLRIVFGDTENPNDAQFIKYFFFQKVNSTQKTSERTEVLSIDLVEEHVYINAVKQLSRSYTENLETIMTSILSNELGKKVIKNKFQGTAQGTRKIIVPYLSPLEAVNWIKDRATTRTGCPIYIRGSLFTNDLVMCDLESLLVESPFNEKFPIKYSEAGNSVDDKQEQLRAYADVDMFSELNTDNMMQMFEEGAIGSYYGNLDASTGLLSGEHVSVRDVVDEFFVSGIFSEDAAQSMYDPTLLIDGKLSDEYNSASIFQVSSSQVFNQFKSYHDEAVLLDDSGSIIESKLKIKNKIIRFMLKKNMIDIGMDSRLFLQTQASTGDKLRLLYLSSDVNTDNKDLSEQLDYRKSGDYLIMAINHKFILGQQPKAVLRLTKIAELPKDISL